METCNLLLYRRTCRSPLS